VTLRALEKAPMMERLAVKMNGAQPSDLISLDTFAAVCVVCMHAHKAILWHSGTGMLCKRLQRCLMCFTINLERSCMNFVQPYIFKERFLD
jgi:hypothetical protein